MQPAWAGQAGGRRRGGGGQRRGNAVGGAVGRRRGPGSCYRHSLGVEQLLQPLPRLLQRLGRHRRACELSRTCQTAAMLL